MIRLTSLVLALALASVASAQGTHDLLPAYMKVDDLDPSVPNPDDVIGFPAGSVDVGSDDLRRYFDALVEASPYVTLTPYATSYEGRELYYVTITSRENHARLGEIQANAAALADPRGLADDDAEEILDELPGIAWMAYCIHGDEMSPTDSAMIVAYALAAGTDDVTTALRDDLVVHIDPLQNPDGRARYRAQLESLRGQVRNGDTQSMHLTGLWSAGRTNHYLFDMNRDWLPLSQPETRGRVVEIRSWNPHLLVDAHEMGSLDTYLFDPPRAPINTNLAPTLMPWRGTVSADHAKAFDRFGWPYYTGEWYDEWYPGYTNAWAGLCGAIGILYEAAGVAGHEVTKESGLVVTYARTVHQNVVGSFANLRTLRDNRRGILEDYLADRRWSVSGAAPEVVTHVIDPGTDAGRRDLFLETLRLHGVEYGIAAEAFQIQNATDTWGNEQDAVEVAAGAIIVRPGQPQRRIMHAALELDPRLSDDFLQREREMLERGEGGLMYDVSAWCLSMAYGLEAWEATHVDEVGLAEGFASAPRAGARAEFGVLVPFSDSRVYAMLDDMLEAGMLVRVARKPFRINDTDWPRGTLLVINDENEPRVAQRVGALAERHDVEFQGVSTARAQSGVDLGGREFTLLEAPRVALVTQWPVSSQAFGSTWHLLDARVGMRVSLINSQRLGSIDMRRYNVIVLPPMGSAAAVLDARTLDRLETWVRGGGTLIAIGGSAHHLAGGLSSTELRSAALDDLDAYAEAVARERAARGVDVDPATVWDGDVAASVDLAPPSIDAAPDADTLRSQERWAQRFAPAGVILRAELDDRHWLAYGLGDRLPVMFSGSRVLLSRAPVETPARLASAESLRLSGLLWPEARHRLANSSYATVEGVGNGQIVLFAGDPTFRGHWEATSRLLLNAVLLGPGVGADQPMPW